jgi:anti-sigma factor RsiW
MSQLPRLTCRECVEFLMDYLARELPDGPRANFESHLKACPNCVRYLQTYEATVALGRVAFDATESEVPPEVPEELIQAILSAQRHGQ